MQRWSNYTDDDRNRLINIQLDNEVEYARIESVRFWDSYANDPLMSTDERAFMMEAAERAAHVYQAAAAHLEERLNSKGNSRYTAAAIVLKYLGPEEVGIIVMLEIMTAFLTKWATHDERQSTDSFKCSEFQNLSRVVGKKLFTAALFREARGDNEGMYKAWSTAFKNWDESKMRTFAKKYSSIENMDKKAYEDAGALAIDLLVKNEALTEDPLVYYETPTQKNHGAYKTKRFVFPSTTILTPIVNSTGTEEILSRMVRNPMVVPPVPHARGSAGGYLTEMFRGSTVKTSGHSCEQGVSSCSDLNYKVVNALQETEWAINPMILEVMAHVYYNNHGQCNLPHADIMSSPAKDLPDFPKDGTKEEMKEWAELKALLWGEHYKAQQSRTQMETRLGMARRFSDLTFYHQYHYDFRGRVYASCQMLSPQAGDLDRGLVYYANEYDVDEAALANICINLANLFDGQGPDQGFIGTASDKDTFDERTDWAWNNRDIFREMLKDPILYIAMWEDDARFKNVSFQRLSAAEDFILAVDKGKTRVPVQFDGSCNGYQHWAAMTRDEVSGPEVNLVPRDRPGDLYKKVAKGMDTLLDAMAAAESPYIYAFKDYYGPDGVPRKATKRVVMCDPYGLKEHSMKTYIIVEGHLKWCDTYDWRFAGTDFEFVETRAATEFAKVLKRGLQHVNQRSEEGKQYVMELTAVCGAMGQAMTWTTPSGFKVVNAYRVMDTRSVDQQIYLAKSDTYARLRSKFSVETPDLDVSKMKTTIPPNYVHSLDASHLQLVVDRLLDAGCTDFSMIHDSFGCPAPFAEHMRKEIRNTFYEIHCEPQLELLQAQVEDQLGTAVPAPPSGGDLDILDCLRAEYMFA